MKPVDHIGKIKIQVTWEHIKDGSPTSGSGCPIGLAIQHQTRFIARVESYFIEFFEMDGTIAGYRKLPSHVQQWIEQSMTIGGCEPIEFELGEE